jgi:hypothetical protein
MEIGPAYPDAARPNERVLLAGLRRRPLLDLQLARFTTDKCFDELHVTTCFFRGQNMWGRQ